MDAASAYERRLYSMSTKSSVAMLIDTTTFWVSVLPGIVKDLGASRGESGAQRFALNHPKVSALSIFVLCKRNYGGFCGLGRRLKTLGETSLREYEILSSSKRKEVPIFWVEC